jgi:uncharacterized repeat protein (TIGR01451 family)
MKSPRRLRSRTLGKAALVTAFALVGVFPASALAQGDLSIEVTDSADPATVGSELVYGLQVTNAGPETATGVTVETTVPNEVDLVSATPSQGTCDIQGSRKVNCTLGSLTAGQTVTIDLRTTSQRAGQTSLTATVASASPTDPVAANNTSTEQTTIVEPAPVSCAGKTATLVGTAGNDVLNGTDKVDVIAGLGGDDEINGLDGDDVICAGTGNDLVRSGNDDDVAKGGGGNDRVRGSAGNDRLAGNAGDDNLGGGAGDDVLRGGSGTDRCGGGPGADTRRSCE